MTKLPDVTCVVKVGDGRGFVFEHRGERVILTAAHCLPWLPRAIAVDYPAERTYPEILGDLYGEAKVATGCLFVDPIADVAVLGSPEQEFQAGAYDSFIVVCGQGEVLSSSQVPAKYRLDRESR